ncbi:MAG: M14 family metallopeptidase [Steroidobacter sp.]
MSSEAVGVPLTLAEQTAFRQTGRTDEVERLCQAYAQRWPDAVRSFEYGRSAEGRVMYAMVVSRAGALSPAEIRRRKLPVLMLQAGIHPGESDGKDAGFIALRELLSGSVGAGLLERLAILFVPAFNVDGHERVGRWNRPNQVGPEETGWRATSQNLNLNRDYTKADAPEMQAMLRLLQQWDPLVCADLHVTDGADFEPDVSLQVEPINQGDASLFASGVRMRDELISKLERQGSVPLPFYPDLVEPDNPASGFHLTVYSPRFSTGYFPARNRYTVLVETHSWKDYATRVRVTRNTILGLAELVVAHGAQWLDETQRADVAAKQAGGKEVTLDYAASWRESTKDKRGAVADPDVTTIDFRGYAYKREPSRISGELVTTYDPKTPQIWRVPFRKNTSPSLVITAPRGGYVIPSGYAELIGAKLQLHGIEFRKLGALGRVEAECFRATNVEFSSAPFEGRTRAKITGAWRPERYNVGAGALFVPIAQVHSRLAMVLLEPQAPDSLAAWGFFNGWFEHKEYVEPYVIEIMARDLMQAEPSLAAEFERKLQEDPDFAANPAARREFFYRRHTAWDQSFGLYPIVRVATDY